MDRRWLPLNALRAFEAVGRHASFTAGAQALNVTQSALSRHVMALEDLIGCKLLDRRPQGVALTEAGALLLPVVTRAFDRVEQGLNAIDHRRGEGARRLKVHMPPTFLSQRALPVLRDFRREHPHVEIDITSTNVTGIPDGNFDFAVIFDRPQVGDMVRDLLWMARSTILCAPEIAEAHRGLPLADFISRNELLHVRIEHEQRDMIWSVFLSRCGINVETDRGLAFDTAALTIGAAAIGSGIVIADIEMFAEEIASGRLVAPYDIVQDAHYGYFLAVQPENLSDPATVLFRSWMIARFGRAQALPKASPPPLQLVRVA